VISHYKYQKKQQSKDPLRQYSTEELIKIQNIKLFNTSNITQKFEVCTMVEANATNQERAKVLLQAEAFKFEANAIINVTINIENNVKGKIRSARGMPNIIQGNTSTITTYHYVGTSIKLL